MKVRELIEINEIVTKSVAPRDIDSRYLEKYWSRSKREHIDILDMDIVYLVRAFNRMIQDWHEMEYSTHENR